MDRRIWREPLDEHIVHEDLIHDREMLLRIRRGKGLLVLVRVGLVWITQQGDHRDTLVEAGEWFRLDRDGLTLVYALRGASLTISAPLEAKARWRLERATAVKMLPNTPPRRPLHRGTFSRSFWAWWLRLHRLGEPRQRNQTVGLTRTRSH